jgi:hypothetical protein
MRIIATAVCIMLILMASSVFAEENRTYEIPYVEEEPLIDGEITEDVWNLAPWTEPFVIFYDGSEPKQTTRAKLLWDDEYIYFAFAGDDPDVWSTMTERDEPLFKEEVYEIFIDPDGDLEDYLEIEVNPLNTIFDLILTKAYKDGGEPVPEWDAADMSTAVSIDGTLNDPTDTDEAWYCEVALAFSEVEPYANGMSTPPENGDSWRVNLYRGENSRTPEEIEEPQAWNQTKREGGFHVPEKFGVVIFVGKE